jgi:hypothetical protein
MPPPFRNRFFADAGVFHTSLSSRRDYHHGGILPYVLRLLLGAKGSSEEGRPSYNPPTSYPVSTHSPGIKSLAGSNPPRSTPCLVPRCTNFLDDTAGVPEETGPGNGPLPVDTVVSMVSVK